jgi:integrase/recombinase XerD
MTVDIFDPKWNVWDWVERDLEDRHGGSGDDGLHGVTVAGPSSQHPESGSIQREGFRQARAEAGRHVDIDRERGTVMIRQGKGKKDRMIPIGERALHWIERYQIEVRPELVATRNQNALFLTTLGEAFTPPRLTELVRDYVLAAKLGKSGSCHLFRHTMATLMLENGADIRFIQAMLGHAELSTTQIYTQVSIRKLKEIHTATHPAKARQTRSNAASQDPAASAATPTVDELFNSLAAEAREEDPDA